MVTSLWLKPAHTKAEIRKGLPEAIQEGCSGALVPYSWGKVSYRLLSFAYVVPGPPRERRLKQKELGTPLCENTAYHTKVAAGCLTEVSTTKVQAVLVAEFPGIESFWPVCVPSQIATLLRG